MKLSSVESIVSALNVADVRYIVVGGLAVNAHGYLRFTNDLDLVLQLVPDNVRRALAAFASLGYQPAIPVAAADFADPHKRKNWIREKGMQVLQLWSEVHLETPIDLFVEEPFPFDAEYQNALVKNLHGVTEVRFASVPTLIRMKEDAGREQDRIDVEHLRLILDADEES